MKDAYRAAATATPNFGSVTQSSNVSGSNVTLDTATAAFDGQDVAVIVRQGDSINIGLSTETDFVLGDSGTQSSPIRAGYSHRQRTVGNIVGDDLTLAVVGTDWKTDNYGDYAAFGYWLKIEDFESTSPTAQIGAFVDGPEFRGNPIVPLSGTATYRGRSQGAYLSVAGTNQEIPAGSVEGGDFFGDATLRADFDTSMIGGTIDNVEGYSSAVDPQGQLLYLNYYGTSDFVLTLGNTPIGNGQFTGATSIYSPSERVTSQDGKWGGQLSNQPVSTTDSDPRAVGGTFGGGFTLEDNTEAVYIGVFGAFKQ